MASREVGELARLFGVLTSYRDIEGRRRAASDEALLAALRSLGVDATPGRIPEAVRERELARSREPLEPVVVVWDGRPRRVPLRVPAGGGERRAAVTIAFEDGDVRGFVEDLRGPRGVVRGVESDLEERWFEIRAPLPHGYHRVQVELDGSIHESLLIAAPRHAYGGNGSAGYGIFLPLHSLRTRRCPEAGDYGALGELAEWAGSAGAGLAGTLPVYASFLDEPFDPSPYSPVSRLFLNDLYVDPGALPEVEGSPEARRLLEAGPPEGPRDEVDALALMAWKRQVLTLLCRALSSSPTDRRDAFDSYVRSREQVGEYARFRAAVEKTGSTWQCWSGPSREGDLGGEDLDPDAVRYHLYAQWAAAEQLMRAADRASRAGSGLYLDFPVGVDGGGYDVYRHRGLFALGASAGAPPDDFFTGGQCWGFPPLRPEALRLDGYSYLRRCFARSMEAAKMLRVDHVMGLHRIFFVPDGFPPSEGVYVRYPAEELYAVLLLESHRRRCMVAGENLGTVPRYVNRALRRRRIFGLYVAEFEARPDAAAPLRPSAAGDVAAVNTHDMPTFAGWWKGRDVEDRVAMGLLDGPGADRERARREGTKRALVEFLTAERLLDGTGPVAVHAALVGHLASSRAAQVIVNLEDLWGEERPQNVPGTGPERPNFRRKATKSLQEMKDDPAVVRVLVELARLRGTGRDSEERAAEREVEHEGDNDGA